MQCKRPFLSAQPFMPNLDSPKDRGERHNCCVALAAVMGDQQQVIFLTDDVTAVRDYVDPVFQTLPLGHVWSSFDFALYLFIRHRSRVPQDGIKAVLRDIVAKAVGRRPGDDRPGHEEAQWIRRYEKWRLRLNTYYSKAERIDQVLSLVRGGY